ncbi:hypothetical protein AB0945_43970 [Streptomyces sp. NPDC005474]|uniref:hypothetical protein n=1 Tax=Streptomyces sp. NPDC005474 TaxID=3154878 RepID=UPI003455B5F9
MTAVAPKSVARTGDVSTKAGTTLPAGTDSGAWTPGAVTVTTTDLLTSDGRKVVVEATCDFSFTGKSGNTAVTNSSTVKLKPGSRSLNAGGIAPLVDGDSNQDSYGNTVSVSSDALLQTD